MPCSRSVRLARVCACSAALCVGALLGPHAASPRGESRDGQIWVLDLSGREVDRWPPLIPPGRDPHDHLAIRAILGDGSGGFFLAGGFRRVGGILCPFFAHVVPPGRLDRRWCVRPNGPIDTIQRDHDRLQLGGRFTWIGGVRRSGTAAFDVGTVRPLDVLPGELRAPPKRTVVVGERTGKPLDGARWRRVARSLDAWARSQSNETTTVGVRGAVRHGRHVFVLFGSVKSSFLARYDVRSGAIVWFGTTSIGWAARNLAVSTNRLGVGTVYYGGG